VPLNSCFGPGVAPHYQQALYKLKKNKNNYVASAVIKMKRNEESQRKKECLQNVFFQLKRQRCDTQIDNYIKQFI
jgi:hypothetical protein